VHSNKYHTGRSSTLRRTVHKQRLDSATTMSTGHISQSIKTRQRLRCWCLYDANIFRNNKAWHWKIPKSLTYKLCKCCLQTYFSERLS